MYSLILAAMLTTGGETPNWYGWNCCGCWGGWGGGYYGGWGGYYGYGAWYPGWNGYYGYGAWYPGWYAYYPAYGYFPEYYGAWSTAGLEGSAPSARDGSRATVKVQLPAEAKLYANDTLMNLTSSTRTFVTPQLQEGKEYWYDLEAVWTRDGKEVRKTQKVQLRRGEISEVLFEDARGTEGKTARLGNEAPAHITVRAPAEAKLYVQGLFCPIRSEVRSFDSPPLQLGKKFYYDLEVELVRDGKSEIQTRRVSLEAGQKVEVDFNKVPVVHGD